MVQWCQAPRGPRCRSAGHLAQISRSRSPRSGCHRCRNRTGRAGMGVLLRQADGSAYPIRFLANAARAQARATTRSHGPVTAAAPGSPLASLHHASRMAGRCRRFASIKPMHQADASCLDIPSPRFAPSPVPSFPTPPLRRRPSAAAGCDTRRSAPPRPRPCAPEPGRPAGSAYRVQTVPNAGPRRAPCFESRRMTTRARRA